MQSIHQFVAGFAQRDAVSNEALVMKSIFRSWGFRSEIYSESNRVRPESRKFTKDISEYDSDANSNDIILLHLSTGSRINDYFAELPCKKAILYHNMTPSHYYDDIEYKTAYLLAKGRSQLKYLVNTATVNMTCSKYSADELIKLGYRDIKVLPLMIDFKNLLSKPDRKTLRQFDNGKINILFVGRCAPNKKIEDAISAFTLFNKTVERNSRFIHAGSLLGAEQYYFRLLANIKKLGINNIHFTGIVTQPQLTALYKCADIFLCMSEHEGFCIPIIESMIHDVPVMAYSAAAVPETMDGAGILFKDKNFELIAEMMGKLINDSTFKTAVLRKQRERVERFTARNLETELKEHLKPLLNTAL